MSVDSYSRRKIAESIFQAAVASVMPEKLISRSVSLDENLLRIEDEEYALRPDQKVYVFGSGKGSVGMARSLLAVLGERVGGGIIVTNQPYDEQLGSLKVIQGTHPVPDEKSIRGAEMLINGLAGLAEDDFFIYLLSGGSSALIEIPLENISLAEMQETTRLLLESGVRIQQVNAVRKHLSRVKGGRLAQVTKAAGSVLVISDVIGDDLSVIGSGPLYADETTFEQCMEIMVRRSIWNELPNAVREVIEAGKKGDIPETPKQPRGSLRHHLIGSNRIAIEGARKAAEEHGLETFVLTDSLAGESREAARVLVSIARYTSRTGEPFRPPCCLLLGGETTVTVCGKGKGGRNQEFALAALAEIGTDDTLLALSGGTDGIDGNSTAAGALADSDLFMEAGKQNLLIGDFLDDNNANGFFRIAGGLLETGSTGTNVMDIILLIVNKEEV